MRISLALLKSQRDAICAALGADQNESALLLECGTSEFRDLFDGEREIRALVRRVVTLGEHESWSRSPRGLTWSTTPFYHLAKRVADKKGCVAVVHSHPDGPLAFSEKDDLAERELFEILANRFDEPPPLISLVQDGHGELIGRAYVGSPKPLPLQTIRTIGERWRFEAPRGLAVFRASTYDRQERVFGVDSTALLSDLRVAIVGCGGTGSAMAVLAARLGVGCIALIDEDAVDETSLNRMHFSKKRDAVLKRPKAEVVAEGLADLGLQRAVRFSATRASDPASRNLLLASDVIFGCTDDHLGRNILNRIAHFYFIPVIDVGLLIERRADGGYDVFDGRATVVQPGYPCQVCRGLISPQTMMEEDLRLGVPELYRERVRAGYITGSRDPSPAVVTFTTEVATMALGELMQRLTEFRGTDGFVRERVRKFSDTKDFDTLSGGTSHPRCKLCGKRAYDGRGDMNPFLDQS